MADLRTRRDRIRRKPRVSTCTELGIPRNLAWGCFLWLLGLAPIAASTIPQGWQQVLSASALPGHRPVALALDEAGTPYWIEVGEGTDGKAIGRIRQQASDDDGPPIPLEFDHCALLVWQNQCFLAASGKFQSIRTASVPDPKAPKISELGTISGDVPHDFTGLTLGPDGRLYGGAASGAAAKPADGGGLVFRMEFGGKDLERVHPGLSGPMPPIFDDSGRALVIDGDQSGDSHTIAFSLRSGAHGVGEESSSLRINTPPFQAWMMLDSVPRLDSGERPNPEKAGATWPDGVVAGCRDWNGRPHLLLFHDGDEPRVEILARKTEGDSKPADKAVAAINAHLDGSSPMDASDLTPLLAHNERRVRWLAAWSLTRVPEGFEALASATRNDDPKVRAAGLSGIGILARLGHELPIPGDDSEFSPIPQPDMARRAAVVAAESLKHPSAETRMQALRILASAMRPGGLIPYQTMLKDEDPGVRNQALLTAGQLRQIAVLDLLPKAGKSLPLDLHYLADMMAASFQGKRLVPFRHHPDRRVRWAAMTALQREKSEELGHFVFDDDPGVAGDAVIAIERSGFKELYPLVAKRLDQGLPDAWSDAAKDAARQCARDPDAQPEE